MRDGGAGACEGPLCSPWRQAESFSRWHPTATFRVVPPFDAHPFRATSECFSPFNRVTDYQGPNTKGAFLPYFACPKMRFAAPQRPAASTSLTPSESPQSFSSVCRSFHAAGRWRQSRSHFHGCRRQAAATGFCWPADGVPFAALSSPGKWVGLATEDPTGGVPDAGGQRCIPEELGRFASRIYGKQCRSVRLVSAPIAANAGNTAVVLGVEACLTAFILGLSMTHVFGLPSRFTLGLARGNLYRVVESVRVGFFILVAWGVPVPRHHWPVHLLLYGA